MRTADQTIAFLDERQQIVGASDAPVILGIAPAFAGTPLKVWSKKLGLGLVEKPDADLPSYVEWGSRLEAVVLEKWADDHGAEVEHYDDLSPADVLKAFRQENRPDRVVITMTDPKTGETPLVVNPDRPWMGSHPDAFLWDPERGLGLLQAKTTNAFNRKAWDDGAPIYYRAQVQHEIETCNHLGVCWGALACLIGGNTYRETHEEPNARFVDVMIRKLEMFWEMVKQKVQPDAGDSAADAAILTLLYPAEEEASTIQLPAEAADLTEEAWEVNQQIKDLEARKQGIRNRIMELMETHACGILPGALGTWHWKNQKRKGYTKVMDPWEGRVLRTPRQPKKQ